MTTESKTIWVCGSCLQGLTFNNENHNLPCTNHVYDGLGTSKVCGGYFSEFVPQSHAQELVEAERKGWIAQIEMRDKEIAAGHEIAELCEQYKKALKFYANPEKNTIDHEESTPYGQEDEFGNWDHDNGMVAQEALSKVGEK